MKLGWSRAGQVNGPCETNCDWVVNAWYRDGSTEIYRAQLGQGNEGAVWSKSVQFTAQDVTMGQVSHLEATLTARYNPGADRYSTGWVPVSDAVVDDISLAPYAASLSTAYSTYPTSFCEPLLFSPVSINVNSLPDAYEECVALAGTATVATIVVAVVKAGGLHALDLLIEEWTPADDSDALPARLDEAVVGAQSATWNGFSPRPDCLDPVARQQELDKLPQQTHHLATVEFPSRWTPRFRQIA